jgi:steroid delta-isomerase-like uncharacterized protein
MLTVSSDGLNGERIAAPPQLVGVVVGSGRPDNRFMTNIEANKTIVSEFIQALFTKGDLNAVDKYLAEDFVNNDPPFGASADREGMRSACALFRSVFPDWHTDLHLLVAEGDIVVERFTATGTHTGTPIMGVAPSGQTVTLPGINIFRLRDGRITERWGRLDDLGFRRQLGVSDQT